MICPSELIRPLSEIIRSGILNARAAAWSGDCQRAAIEADHIHNLPGLVIDFSEVRLRYYWEVERQTYLKTCDSGSIGGFQRFWEELRQYIEQRPA